MTAIEIAKSAQSCLLCFERRHTCCHRSIVAEAMADREDFRLRHLGVRTGFASERNRPYELVNGTCTVG